MLWAITSYFNPAGYRNRLENFRKFRRRLAVPLLAVEFRYGERFELEDGDADLLLRLPGRDVLWQKERLLNVAMTHLPAECTAVASLDCDVVFERDDWGATRACCWSASPSSSCSRASTICAGIGFPGTRSERPWTPRRSRLRGRSSADRILSLPFNPSRCLEDLRPFASRTGSAPRRTPNGDPRVPCGV